MVLTKILYQGMGLPCIDNFASYYIHNTWFFCLKDNSYIIYNEVACFHLGLNSTFAS